MARFSVFLISIAAVALLGIGAYVVLTYVPAGAGGAHAVALATSTVSEKTDAYAIDAHYPQFGIPAVDTQIAKIETDAITDLKAQPAVMHGESAAQNSFYGRFDSPYVGPDYVSVELTLSEYTGGAHPITAFQGVVFDRKTGKRLTLDDILPLTGKTLGEVSSSSAASLAAQLKENYLFPEGAAPTSENYSSFTLDADSITFIFQQYQVAPYAYGPQRVSFTRVR